MARIRTVKPEFFRHEALFEAEQSVSLPLRLAFAGLFTVADREGRFRWQPRVLKLDVMPFDAVDFGVILDALHAYGFVDRYRVDGQEYGVIPSWRKHQQINARESASTIPAPDASGAEKCVHPSKHVHAHDRNVSNDGNSSNINDLSKKHVHAHALTSGEGKGREGKRKGIKKNNSDHSAAAALAPMPTGVDPSVWRDFQALRKSKKAPLTHTALQGIRREADKAGIPLEAALRVCCMRGWQGFDAGWVNGSRLNVVGMTNEQIAAEAMRLMETSNATH